MFGIIFLHRYEPGNWPLCAMARAYKPFAAGAPASRPTARPPAEPPNIVTRVGSPPNCAMLACTPFEGCNHVEKSALSCRKLLPRFERELRMCEEAKGPEPIGDRDQNHAFGREFRSVRQRFPGHSSLQAPAMYPDHHWAPFLRGGRRGPDIQIQTVFAGGIRLFPPGLNACRSECVCHPDSAPGHDRLWHTPA